MYTTDTTYRVLLLVLLAASFFAGYGCNSSPSANCSGEQLLEAQSECLEYGKDFYGASDAEGVIGCDISNASGSCSIKLDSSCTILCVTPGEATSTNHTDGSGSEQDSADETTNDTGPAGMDCSMMGCACDGACVGSCELGSGSTCDGICMGSCNGTCGATTPEGSCNGTCDGICDGVCINEEGAPCAGTCLGTCIE